MQCADHFACVLIGRTVGVRMSLVKRARRAENGVYASGIELTTDVSIMWKSRP
jgi:hypothetical protein